MELKKSDIERVRKKWLREWEQAVYDFELQEVCLTILEVLAKPTAGEIKRALYQAMQQAKDRLDIAYCYRTALKDLGLYVDLTQRLPDKK
jgi:hypothetical protein